MRPDKTGDQPEAPSTPTKDNSAPIKTPLTPNTPRRVATITQSPLKHTKSSLPSTRFDAKELIDKIVKGGSFIKEFTDLSDSALGAVLTGLDYELLAIINFLLLKDIEKVQNELGRDLVEALKLPSKPLELRNLMAAKEMLAKKSKAIKSHIKKIDDLFPTFYKIIGSDELTQERIVELENKIRALEIEIEALARIDNAKIIDIISTMRDEEKNLKEFFQSVIELLNKFYLQLDHVDKLKLTTNQDDKKARSNAMSILWKAYSIRNLHQQIACLQTGQIIYKAIERLEERLKDKLPKGRKSLQDNKQAKLPETEPDFNPEFKTNSGPGVEVRNDQKSFKKPQTFTLAEMLKAAKEPTKKLPARITEKSNKTVPQKLPEKPAAKGLATAGLTKPNPETLQPRVVQNFAKKPVGKTVGKPALQTRTESPKKPVERLATKSALQTTKGALKEVPKIEMAARKPVRPSVSEIAAAPRSKLLTPEQAIDGEMPVNKRLVHIRMAGRETIAQNGRGLIAACLENEKISLPDKKLVIKELLKNGAKVDEKSTELAATLEKGKMPNSLLDILNPAPSSSILRAKSNRVSPKTTGRNFSA